MVIVSAHNPRWSNAAHTAIVLQVQFEELEGEVSFSAMVDDVESHGRELFTRALNGEFGAIGSVVLPVEDLLLIKRQLIDQIDQIADSRLVTSPSKVLVYNVKVDEARRASVELNPQPNDYPLLSATIGIDGPDIKSVAATVLQKYEQWIVAIGQIERIRVQARAAISAATTADAARAACNAANFPTRPT